MIDLFVGLLTSRELLAQHAIGSVVTLKVSYTNNAITKRYVVIYQAM